MVSAFALLASSGQPSIPGMTHTPGVLPFWPAWDPLNRSTMVLDVSPAGARVVPRLRGQYCHVWDGVHDAQTPVSVA